MKFIITQDKTTNWCTWNLVTNADKLIASSATPFPNLEEAQTAITEFKAWVGQAPVSIIAHEQHKDWRQLAMDQLKKTPWTKG